MNLADSPFLANLGSPPLLFFFLGIVAALARSDLEIPAQIAKLLSLYLLMAIGFKGGVALATSPLDLGVAATLGAAVLLALAVPVYVFYLARRRLTVADAAAVAATYGSVSAVTFVTATSYLDSAGIAWGGHLVAAMALMESPAIVVGILLYRRYGGEPGQLGGGFGWQALLREACLNGSVVLILGSMLIGWFTGPTGMAQVKAFVSEIFIGMLCLFLLDMGVVAARRLREFSTAPGPAAGGWMFPVSLALLLPLGGATLAYGLAWMLGLSEGDALLLVVLGASASYIAVPAAMRLAVPASNPSIYLPMSLALTFPFNLLLGIPLYHQWLRLFPTQ